MSVAGRRSAAPRIADRCVRPPVTVHTLGRTGRRPESQRIQKARGASQSGRGELGAPPRDERALSLGRLELKRQPIGIGCFSPCGGSPAPHCGGGGRRHRRDRANKPGALARLVGRAVFDLRAGGSVPRTTTARRTISAARSAAGQLSCGCTTRALERRSEWRRKRD
jgi:hypothetical protein